MNGVLRRALDEKQKFELIYMADKHSPDQVVVLGGDCGVELAPFAYLNAKYDGDTE